MAKRKHGETPLLLSESRKGEIELLVRRFVDPEFTKFRTFIQWVLIGAVAIAAVLAIYALVLLGPNIQARIRNAAADATQEIADNVDHREIESRVEARIRTALDARLGDLVSRSTAEFIQSGLKGEAGLPGTSGQQGAQGALGPTGDKGDPGERGVRGEDGRDATGPIGCVVAWLRPHSDIPNGWEVCDGQIAQDPSETFSTLFMGAKKPDLRGFFLRGASDPNGVDPEGLREPGTRQEHAIEDHKHYIGIHDGGPKHPGILLSQSFERRAYISGAPDPEAPSATSTQVYQDGGGQFSEKRSNETRPVNIAVHWIIKVR